METRELCLIGSLLLCGLTFASPAVGESTERVSVSSKEIEGDRTSTAGQVSADGRFVVFWSDASNLVPNDTNGKADVFVRDRQTGTTELVSIAVGGGPISDDSYGDAISDDGRFVAFATGPYQRRPIWVRYNNEGSFQLRKAWSSQAIVAVGIDQE
jgi:Tol biopolymer transport system component